MSLQRRLHVLARLLDWVSRTARHVYASPRGWAAEVELSAAAVTDLLWVVRDLLESTVFVGPPLSLPARVDAVIYTDASELGWGVVIAFADRWWAAHGTWGPAAAAEVIFFLELRALLRGLELAYDRLGLTGVAALLRVDNLPGVHATARGCSSTALGNRLLADVDAAARRLGGVVGVEWVSTDRELADPFSRVALGAAPRGCGAPFDLVALDHPPLDPAGRPPPPALYAAGPDAKVINLAPTVARRGAGGLWEL